ncbi:DMT family transporter [Alphaproteobacteria bacterium]|nr:DMT family transporter [Alphaproteobacteria bacterium]
MKLAMGSGLDIVQKSLAWMTLSCLFFSLVMVSIRLFLTDLPTEQSVFLRYTIGSFMVLPFLGLQAAKFWKWKHKGQFALRAGLHGAGVYTWFFALLLVPLAEINALLNLGPIYATLGAVIFFGERLKMRRIMAIVISFIGALIVIKPGFSVINIGVIAILATAPLFSMSDLIAKNLKTEHDDSQIIFGLSTGIAILLFVPALFVWQPMSVQNMIGVACISGFATMGHFTLMKAFRGPMWAAQTGKYIQLLFVIIFGIILFDEIPTLSTIVGALVVLASVTYIGIRESQINRANNAAKAMPSKE